MSDAGKWIVVDVVVADVVVVVVVVVVEVHASILLVWPSLAY